MTLGDRGIRPLDGLRKKALIALDNKFLISKVKNPTGLTLLEIIISTLIFALIMTGLVNLFVAAKRLTLHSRSRMAAGELGKLFLDPLQMAVRQDTWSDSTNPLQAGISYCDGIAGHTQHPYCPPSVADRTLDNIIYNAKCTITRDSPLTNINKVKVDITWSETQP